jgi:hypothetical protein
MFYGMERAYCIMGKLQYIGFQEQFCTQLTLFMLRNCKSWRTGLNDNLELGDPKPKA